MAFGEYPLSCHVRWRYRLTPHLFGNNILIDDIAAYDMFIDDPVDLLFVQLYIHRMPWLYEHDGPLLASVEAACLDGLYCAYDTFLHQCLRKMLKKLLRLGVILTYATGLWHSRRCGLLAFKNIESGLWYTIYHLGSFLL